MLSCQSMRRLTEPVCFLSIYRTWPHLIQRSKRFRDARLGRLSNVGCGSRTIEHVRPSLQTACNSWNVIYGYLPVPHCGEVGINVFTAPCRIPFTWGQTCDNGHRESTWSGPCPALACHGKAVLEESLSKGKLRAPWTIPSACWCRAKFSKHVSSAARGSDSLNILIDGDRASENCVMS